MRVSGLSPGATYAFSLSAGNAVGYGPAVKFRVTTLPDQPPPTQPHTDNGNISFYYAITSPTVEYEVLRCVCLFVCLSVCLSVHSHNSKTARPNFAKFLCTLPVAVARSFSDGAAIRYVLPVL